jgi:hypothetical protein
MENKPEKCDNFSGCSVTPSAAPLVKGDSVQTESQPSVRYEEMEALPKVPLVLGGLSSRFIRENRIVPV